jgi:hypothetical protein
MSNILRKLRKQHALNDPSQWTTEMRPPYFDVQAYQKRLDERVGLNREGKSILKLVWAPQAIGLYGIPRYWVTRVKDGEKWIYTSAPRFVFESRVEKAQYAPSWEAMRFTMSEEEGFVPTSPPEDFYMFRWLCAEHENIDPVWGKPRCCQRAWEPNRLRCWGTYRAPNDYDLECVSKALQVREQSQFIDAYAPLSPADLMMIEANSVKQMAELATKEQEERMAIGRDFDKRNKWRLSNTMPATHDRFFDIGASNKVILTDN